MRSVKHNRRQFILLITILLTGVLVIVGGTALAQVWEEPISSPPIEAGSPNPGPVIFSGGKTNASVGCTSGVCGGGEAQARTAGLRVGDTLLPTEKLEVANTMYGTSPLVAGRDTYPDGSGGDPIVAMVNGYAGAPYNSYSFGIYGMHKGGVTMDGGDTWVLARDSDGSVWSWGNNDYGQLGFTTPLGESPVPGQVVGPGGAGFLTDVISVSAGIVSHSLALKKDGTVWAWGQGDVAGLGDGTINNSPTPVQVIGPGGVGVLNQILMVGAGGNTSFALKTDGTAWAWGSNGSGQLGDGTNVDRLFPIQVVGPGGVGFFSNITQMATGSSFTVVLKSDGTVWAWGDDNDGQLGNGTPNADSTTPVQVKGSGGVGFLTNVKMIGTSTHSGYAVKTDGTTWAWGNNLGGVLGDGTSIQRNTPVQVLGPGGIGFLEDIQTIIGTGTHTLAVDQQNRLWAWGLNSSHQLGDGTTANRNTPVQVKGPAGVDYLLDARNVGGGFDFSFAVLGDGSVWAWGDDGYGTLGDDIPNVDMPLPVRVASPINTIETFSGTLGAAITGIYGATAVDGGRALYGDGGVSNSARGVYGDAEGVNSYAIHGRNTSADANSYAGYFVGAVEIVSALAPALDVEGDAAFANMDNTEVTVTDNLSVPSGSVFVDGIDLEKINALSIQDQMQAVPSTAPGVQYFSMSADDVAADGIATLTAPLAETDYLTQLSVLYRDSADTQARWKVFGSAGSPGPAYRQCAGLGVWINLETFPGAPLVWDTLEADNGWMYATTTDDAKVYRSQDRGRTWSPTGDLVGALLTEDIIQSSNGWLFVGTGNNGNVYRSKNYGDTWEELTVGGFNVVDSLIQASNDWLYAGLGFNGRIYRSQDGGDTWVQVNNLGGSESVWDLFEASNSWLYAGMNSGSIYRSQDNGSTWNLVTTLPGVSIVWTFTQGSDGTLYAGTGENTEIFESTDNGNTWASNTVLTSTGFPPQRVKSLITVSNGYIYAGTGGVGEIYRSTDNGGTWESVSQQATSDTNNIFEGSDGYIYSGTGTFVGKYSVPIYLPDAAGSIALRNTTGSQADFRIVGSYIPGVNLCP